MDISIGRLIKAGERRERVDNWWRDGAGSGADNLLQCTASLLRSI
jgi:hypothetical protein